MGLGAPSRAMSRLAPLCGFNPSTGNSALYMPLLTPLGSIDLGSGPIKSLYDSAVR